MVKLISFPQTASSSYDLVKQIQWEPTLGIHTFRESVLVIELTVNFIHSFIFLSSVDSNFYPMQTSPRRRSPYDGISLLIFL